ncbi:ThiF family adenylyltransferase [Nocardioides sp. BP30]|uniref:HesA/MoeB/ThiF family protein n=1 Tax=Nocardioides sp. BP30 TaxID=3036374 RepID=UPI002468FDA5|nr:ThiF family adenylyltransferase [Nocardioides sp. BP30]WGL52131.1 ThiF family adenylyltransferase [Nocardioides sp. BP30]
MTRPAGTRPTPVQVRFRGDDWCKLQGHLFPGDNGEHGAALLCGQAIVDGHLHLLVREVIPAIDGVDYVPGTRGHRHLDGAFVTRQLRRAKNDKLVYLAVHNHGGRHAVGFSTIDLASHERGYPTLLQLNGRPVGALVLAREAVAGDIWFTDGHRAPVDVTVAVGDKLTELTADGRLKSAQFARPDEARYARQALVFGQDGQAKMGRLRVGVVGTGGVGMLIVQALSRLGVGEFVIIDADTVSTSNLSRLPETYLRDAEGRLGTGPLGRLAKRFGLNRPSRKVDVARRIIRGANPTAKVTTICGDVADDHVARALLGCDFIFLAADTMLARDVVNQIAFQCLIPTLQVGSKAVVEPATGDVRDIFGVVRSLGAAPGCLRCNDLVNLARLSEETVGTAAQRENQRYVDEPGVEAPSVITLNSMSAGWAVNDFMHYASGLGRPSTGFRILRLRPTAPGRPQLIDQEPEANEACHVCSTQPYSALATGDATDLPTRVRRR